MASLDLRIDVDDLWRRKRGDNRRCVGPGYGPGHGRFTQLGVGNLGGKNVGPETSVSNGSLPTEHGTQMVTHKVWKLAAFTKAKMQLNAARPRICGFVVKPPHANPPAEASSRTSIVRPPKATRRLPR